MQLIQQLRIVILLSTVALGACSGGSNDQSESNHMQTVDTHTDDAQTDDTDARQFESDWTLTSYSLDDGTVVPVPESIQDVGLYVSRADSMLVRTHLCRVYTISYVLDNGVLTTSDPDYPPESCGETYEDVDNERRSTLVQGAFLNTQTMIAISGDMLTVTTVNNELLNFER